jgi:hypothetical protein
MVKQVGVDPDAGGHVGVRDQFAFPPGRPCEFDAVIREAVA